MSHFLNKLALLLLLSGTANANPPVIWSGDDALFLNSGTIIVPGLTPGGVCKADSSGIFSASDVDLSSEVTGVLPIANGGTNSSSTLNNNRVMQSSGGAIVEAAGITAARALVSDANGIPTHSATTDTEIGYVSGVTSAIQTQLNGKQATGNYITALTGDVTATGPGSVAATIANSAVTNAKMANMADQTFKGNNSGGSAAPLDLTATQATAMLNVFTGDSGAGGVKGLVPAPTINQGFTNKYLAASGTFTHPGIKMTPSEGVVGVSTWTGRTAAAANQWFGSVWAPELGLFCSVASSGTNRVQWSRDGISWTSASAAAARVWTKITWSPELRLFAAVAFDGTTADNVMTSPDCRTWTSRTGTEANQWYDIKWSSQLAKFLAVSINGTNRCMSSTDGITWSTCSMAAAIQWYSVTWSPELSLYAAVAITASGGNYAATSPDGVTWTMRALTTGNTWYSVTWAPELGLFVAVGATGTSRAATSPDGVTWTLRGIQAHAWRRVAWSPQLRQLVAVASGGQISTSPDGVTWTARTSPESNQWYEIVWSPELAKFVVHGITGTSRVLTSKDMGSLIGNKHANFATPSNTSEQIIRRDQNGSFSANVVNATNVLVNSGVAATNATIVNLNGHYKSTQTTAPTTTVNANAGTGATCTVAQATDTAGTVTLTTGSAAWAAGAQCAINFNLAYNLAPKCMLTPADADSALAALNTYKTSSTTQLTLNFVNADIAGTIYDWDYFCAETN